MSDILLDVSRLNKRFGGLLATRDLDLDVRHGETHALIGPNGAGKTTLIGQLSGALRPDSGRITFGGRDVTRLSVPERVRAGIGRSFQISSFFPQFSTLQNVSLSVQARHGTSFRFWRRQADDAALYEESAAILCEVGLEGVADIPAAGLSHGEHRQLELALALATRPKLLLLDEPMAGMSGEESDRMLTLIEKLKARFSILLVEHDMKSVFRLADRISVLVSGRVIATGTPDEIRHDPEVRKAYLGDEQPAPRGMEVIA